MEYPRGRPRLVYRLWRVFLWSLGVVLVALAFFGIVALGGADRLAAATVLLPGGLVFLSWAAIPHATRRCPSRVGVRQVRARGSRREAVVIPTSSVHWWLVTVMLASFAMIGVGVAVSAEDPTTDRVVGAALAAMFAVGTLIGGSLALRPPSLALRPDGILLRAARTSAFIPWEAIDDVEAYRQPPPSYHGLQPPREEWSMQLGFHVSDLDVVELPGWIRVLQAMGCSPWQADLSAPLDGVAVPAERVERVIRRLLSSPTERHRLGSAEGRVEVKRVLQQATNGS